MSDVQRNFKFTQERVDEVQLLDRMSKFAVKMAWFMMHEYFPHYYQVLFHTMHSEEEKLLRFRHLVAGRRGGKTLSAAWDVLFYCLFPTEFHWDVHQKKDERPLHTWVLTKDYPTGRAAWSTFLGVIRQVGLTHGREFKMNKGERYFEFENGSLVEFKTAEDPESLRGAGLDILWIDEAAFIRTKDAYVVTRPALSDKLGIVLTTTTPSGKNWLYEEFWNDQALVDEFQGRVEYRSLDNPYFPKEEWEYAKKTMHPLLFKREYMAAFDAMAGKELHGDWLHYYTMDKDPKHGKTPIPRQKDDPRKLDLIFFMGIDPASSLSDQADYFAMALIGVTKDYSKVFLVDTFKDRIPFPEQVETAASWHVKYSPQLIGAEAVAYQAVLAQQLERLPGFLPVIPVFPSGARRKKKEERILGMAPLFKIGKVLIREDQRDFIDEWVDYDPALSNPKDDLLDAVEIAISMAGSLLPSAPAQALYLDDMPAADVDELARRSVPGGEYAKTGGGMFDEHFGGEW